MFKLTPIAVVLFVTTAVNLIAFTVIWQRRRAKWGGYFALGMLGVTFWTLVSALDYAAIPLSLKIFFAKIEPIGYLSALAFFALFALSYAGHEDWAEKTWVRGLLLFVVIADVLIIATNELHGLIWVGFARSAGNTVIFEHGPAFVWVALSTYPMTLTIIVNLWLASRRGSEVSRRQGRLLFYAMLIPLLTNFVYLFGVKGMEGVDWSSVTFSISSLLILIALYGRRLLELTPIARHTIIEQMDDCILVLDANNEVLDFNLAAHDAFGINQKHFGVSINIVMADRPEVLDMLSSDPANNTQAARIYGDGSSVFSVRVNSLIDKRGGVYGKIIVFRDITERYQDEQTLKQQLAEIHMLNKNLNESQSLVVEQQRELAKLEERENLGRDLHDGIAQTLGYLGIQIDLVRNTLPKNSPAGIMQTLSNLGDTTRFANHDLREYILKLQDGESAANDRQDFFSALRQYCASVQRDHQFNVILNLPPNPPYVLASVKIETQLTHIIHEALHNARKHSGVLEASVSIEVDESFVQAIVEDHGKGMGPAYCGPERRQGMHFGMGIMRSRAEDVGGSLRVETSPNTGTRIIVRLPRKLAEENLAGLRILLADDHPLFIEGLRNMLAARGAQVLGIARDGIEALEMTHALKPDLLLMDVNMPRMNGLEATRSINADMPKVKIVMLTSAMDEENLFIALHAGAAGYLLKGMNTNELITLLGEIAFGEAVFSTDTAARMLEVFARPELQVPSSQPRERLANLTDTQRDILSLAAQGVGYKEIGRLMFVTERTIKYHMGEVLKRLQVKGRREAVAYAKQQGVTQRPPK